MSSRVHAKRRRGASRIAGALGFAAAGAPLLFSLSATASATTPPQPPTGLTVVEAVGQAVLGAPITVTLTVTAPTDAPAQGLVISQVLPAGASLVADTQQPAGVHAVTTPPPATGPTSPTVLLTGIPDLAAGASTTVSYQFTTAAPIGTVLAVQGSATASSPARPAETAPVSGAAATVTGIGLQVAGAAPVAPVAGSTGARTMATTVTVTEAPGLAPATVDVEAYLPAGTGLGAATPGQPSPASANATVNVDPATGMPALPVTSPAPPAPGTPAPATPPPPVAGFTVLHWPNVAVDPTHAATLTVTITVPNGAGTLLWQASGSTVVAPSPGTSASPAGVPVPSTVTATEAFAALPPPVPPVTPAPPVVATTPAPRTVAPQPAPAASPAPSPSAAITVPAARRTAGHAVRAAVTNGSANQQVAVTPLPAKPSIPVAPVAVAAPASTPSTRDPFLSPGASVGAASSSSGASTSTPVAPPTTQAATSAALPQTGANVSAELLMAGLGIAVGAAAVLGSARGRRHA